MRATLWIIAASSVAAAIPAQAQHADIKDKTAIISYACTELLCPCSDFLCGLNTRGRHFVATLYFAASRKLDSGGAQSGGSIVGAEYQPGKTLNFPATTDRMNCDVRTDSAWAGWCLI